MQRYQSLPGMHLTDTWYFGRNTINLWTSGSMGVNAIFKNVVKYLYSICLRNLWSYKNSLHSEQVKGTANASRFRERFCLTGVQDGD